MISIDGSGSRALNRNHDVVHDRHGVGSDDLHTVSAEGDVGGELNRAVTAARIQFQHAICTEHTGADAQHAAVTQSTNLDDVRVHGDKVGATTTEIDFAGASSIADINQSTVGRKRAFHINFAGAAICTESNCSSG